MDCGYYGCFHVRFHADMKPKAINRSHRCFLRLNASKFPGKEDERILVVGVHVLNDLNH